MKAIVIAILGILLCANFSLARSEFDARLKLIDAFEQRDCYASADELREAAAGSGLSPSDFKAALKMLRADGSIDSRKENGVYIIRLLNEGACGGHKKPPPHNLAAKTPAAAQYVFNAMINFMERNGCVATRDELKFAAKTNGASEGQAINALQVLGASGMVSTIRDSAFNGVRLTGTTRCPH
jgi:hypothetical protein